MKKDRKKLPVIDERELEVKRNENRCVYGPPAYFAELRRKREEAERLAAESESGDNDEDA